MGDLKFVTLMQAGEPIKVSSNVFLPATASTILGSEETYVLYKPPDTSRLFTVANDWQHASVSNYAKTDSEYDSHLRASVGISLEVDTYDLVRDYEKKYGLSSPDFYKQWLQGSIEDTEDYYNWASLYSMLR
jgi:hypothetical protein